MIYQGVKKTQRRIQIIRTILVPLSIVFYLIIAPYRLAFSIYSTTWMAIDLALDSIFMIAGALYFYLRHREKDMLNEYAAIRIKTPVYKNHFLYSTLLIFIVSTPWELIHDRLIMLKLVQILNARAIKSSSEKIKSTLVSGDFALKLRILGPLRTVLITLSIIIHLSACFWIFTGIEVPDSWLYVWDPEYSNSNFSVYIQGLMYMTETLSTVGYGDTPPNSETQYWVPMIVQFVSSYAYTHFIVVIKDVVHKFQKVGHLTQLRKDEIYSWLLMLQNANESNMYSDKFSNHLQDFVVGETAGNIQQNLKIDSHFNSLSYEVQYELLSILLRPVLEIFKDFFENLSKEFQLGFLLEIIRVDFENSKRLFVGESW